MSDDGTARILDLKAIERFKAALGEFGETIKSSLLESDSEIERSIVWIERERMWYWKRQIQRRQEELVMARSALFRKQTQGSSKDGRPSVVDEKIALEKAKRRLRSGQERYEACRRWRTKLERDYSIYKGQVQPLASAGERDVGEAITLLERLLRHLDQYVRGVSGAEEAISELLAEDHGRSMKRGTADQSVTEEDNDEPNETTERSES